MDGVKKEPASSLVLLEKAFNGIPPPLRGRDAVGLSSLHAATTYCDRISSRARNYIHEIKWKAIVAKKKNKTYKIIIPKSRYRNP